MNTQTHRYSPLAKTLHWLCALLVIALLAIGFVAKSVHGPMVKTLFGLHKDLGLTLLILMIIRLYHRLKRGHPAPLPAPRYQQIGAWLTHITLYVLIFVTILVGWSMSAFAGHETEFWGLINVSLPFAVNKPIAHLGEFIHEWIAWALIVLISLHLLAALYHHFICKDDTLKRMW